MITATVVIAFVLIALWIASAVLKDK